MKRIEWVDCFKWLGIVLAASGLAGYLLSGIFDHRLVVMGVVLVIAYSMGMATFRLLGLKSMGGLQTFSFSSAVGARGRRRSALQGL